MYTHSFTDDLPKCSLEQKYWRQSQKGLNETKMLDSHKAKKADQFQVLPNPQTKFIIKSEIMYNHSLMTA